MLLLQLCPGGQQSMALCCIQHAQLQQPVITQLQQLLACNPLQDRLQQQQVR